MNHEVSSTILRVYKRSHLSLESTEKDVSDFCMPLSRCFWDLSLYWPRGDSDVASGG